MKQRAFLAMVAVASTGILAWGAPQDPDDGQMAPDMVRVSQLELVQYRPQNADPHELQRLARSLVGREFYVFERGGYEGEAVPNLTVLGDSLVLYDTDEYLKTMMKSLITLDQSNATMGTAQELSTFEYRPRYVSLDSVAEVLRPFRRQLRETPNRNENLAFAEDRSLLVVRDTPDAIDEMRALLERIDVPEDQVLVTCHLLEGTDEPGVPSNLPGELVANLEKLLPGYGFEPSSFAMLRASVVLGRRYELRLQGQYDEHMLSFAPVAYDRNTNALTVERCELVWLGSPGAAEEQHKTVFSTDTIFRGQEYTVLGATGAEPIFVVVRVTPMNM